MFGYMRTIFFRKNSLNSSLFREIDIHVVTSIICCRKCSLPILRREQSFSADTGVADHAREPGQASGSSGGESASGENRGM